MKDIQTVAQELALSPQTINTRIRVLGIVPTEIREDGKPGRGKRCLTPEQVETIASYGKTKPIAQDYGDENQSVDTSALMLRSTIAAPLATQFSAISNQLEAIEDQASEALSARVAAMPQRILAKTAARLQGLESLDISEIFGVLQTPALPARSLSECQQQRLKECI